MKKILIIFFVLSGVAQMYASGPRLFIPEIQNVSFITEGAGYNSIVLNPAALARSGDDDGVYVTYNTLKDGSRDETNFNLSMGNLAFGNQKFTFQDANESLPLNFYGMAMAIGGRVLSIGTLNKVVELQWPHHHTRIFSVDAGFIFQPVSWFTLAGFARNLDNAQLQDILFKRDYTSGVSLNLFSRKLRIMGQAMWDDDVRYVEDATYKAGLAFSPVPNANIIFGGIQDPRGAEEFFGLVQFPVWGGICFTLAARMDEKGIPQKYLSSIYFPLKTVTF